MRKMSMLCVAGALSLGGLAATYYAAPDGTGSAGTEAAPCSLATGIDKVKTKAHTLILKQGRYLLGGTPIALNGTDSVAPTVIRGETDNPADVILDAQGLSEAMRLNRNILVSGITIMNGSNASSDLSVRAAGVRVGYNTNVGTLSVVSNCVVTCCTNEFTSSTKNGSGLVIYGGAVCVYDTGLLVDSIVTNNTAAYRCGGVVVKNGEVRGCTISDNTAASGGAGVFIERASSGLIADSTISCNDAGSQDGGGGVACFIDGSSLTLTNCTLSGNSARWGGGADIRGGLSRLVDCRFVGNVATNSGGGLRVCQASTVDVSGCVFDGNQVYNSNSGFGGGCAVYNQNNGGSICLT